MKPCRRDGQVIYVAVVHQQLEHVVARQSLGLGPGNRLSHPCLASWIASSPGRADRGSPGSNNQLTSRGWALPICVYCCGEGGNGRGSSRAGRAALLENLKCIALSRLFSVLEEPERSCVKQGELASAAAVATASAAQPGAPRPEAFCVGAMSHAGSYSIRK